MKHRAIIATALVLSAFAAANELIQLPLQNMEQWQTHSFVGEAEFIWQSEENCLLLRSDNTASARIWEKPITLTESTWITWQWQPRVSITGVNQRDKTGGDFPARVYIAVQHPLFFWRSRVLTYVHANTEPVNSSWTNPFSGQFEMIVVSNGTEPIWHTIERNIGDDWYAAFGDSPEQFNAVGIMADSDNTGQSTELCMADLSIYLD